MSRARESPALGVRGAPGGKKGLAGGLAGPFCAACHNTVMNSYVIRKVLSKKPPFGFVFS